MSVSGADIVNTAAKELGDPYVFGAEGPNRFDCSGLVQYVFKQFGIKTPRVAADQAHFGSSVSRAKIQPGDLIFFNWGGQGKVDHVGIYAGSGQMIHAPHSGTVVKKVKLTNYHWANMSGIRRFPGVTGGPATVEASSGVAGAVAGAVGALPGSATLTDAVKGIAGSAAGIAEGIGSVGRTAELVTKMFLPSNILRGVMGLFGALFLLLGIFFLSREVRG